MMHPLTGHPDAARPAAVAMWVVLGQWVAGGVVGIHRGRLMLGLLGPVHPGRRRLGLRRRAPALYTILAGEFGVLTMTPTYLIGVILPLVTGFYLLLSLLEDSGYLPRIAALSDRSLTAVGLNGRAVIPLILGLGCVTMGTLTTRILGSKRERFIATALMAIAVPCSAQIAVIAGAHGPDRSRYYIGALRALPVRDLRCGRHGARQAHAGAIHRPAHRPSVSLRLPRLDNVVRKTLTKVWHFMKEVTVFFAGGRADHLGARTDRRARLDHRASRRR